MNCKDVPSSIKELEDALSRPTAYVIEALAKVEGDILILGAGGKMGPSLSVMAKHASDKAGVNRRVMAASRFSSMEARDYLTQQGVETFVCDFMKPGSLGNLPDAANIVYMAGMKFGATQQLGRTWAMNVWLPGEVCTRFPNSRIAVFSTGNIYGLVPVSSGGSKEEDLPQPQGEYAMSTLGRERVFEHFSIEQGMLQSIIRLNLCLRFTLWRIGGYCLQGAGRTASFFGNGIPEHHLAGRRQCPGAGIPGIYGNTTAGVECYRKPYVTGA